LPAPSKKTNGVQNGKILEAKKDRGKSTQSVHRKNRKLQILRSCRGSKEERKGERSGRRYPKLTQGRKKRGKEGRCEGQSANSVVTKVKGENTSAVEGMKKGTGGIVKKEKRC